MIVAVYIKMIFRDSTPVQALFFLHIHLSLGLCIKFTSVENLIVWSCEVMLSLTFYGQLKVNLSPHLVLYLGKLSPKALRTRASAKTLPF